MNIREEKYLVLPQKKSMLKGLLENLNISNNVLQTSNFSKYIYNYNEVNLQTYIFELVLKDTSNNSKIIRKVQSGKQGNLISLHDNILYNNIKKYKITILDCNNPEKNIVIKNCINHNLNSNIYFNNNIYIEINQRQKYMDINYNINF